MKTKLLSRFLSRKALAVVVGVGTTFALMPNPNQFMAYATTQNGEGS